MEWTLLALVAVIQLVLLVIGWGDFNNGHGGAALLIVILMLGFLSVLGSLLKLLVNRTRWRALHFTGIVSFSILLLTLCWNYGG